jgi:tetratricopeptide (TPR) repeat protein
MKKRKWVMLSLIVIFLVILGFVFLPKIPGLKFISKFTKKKVPPQELFTKAEDLRKNGYLSEAAAQYDELFDQSPQSELASEALYYSGTCKYTVSLHCPGKKEFEQQKAGLSDAKKKQYQECLDYMEKRKDAFTYDGTADKYLYKGTEFEKLITQYPASNVVDDAAFQLVQTQITAKQHTKTLTPVIALQLYTEFVQKYPKSEFRQKGIEDLVQLISQNAEPLQDAKTLAETYRKLAALFDKPADLSKLSSLLGKKLIETGDFGNAATVLGVPSIMGLGVVETQQTRLNIRGGQGTEYKVVGKAEKGEQVLVLKDIGQWYQVQLQNGTIGYARKDFIKLTTPQK